MTMHMLNVMTLLNSPESPLFRLSSLRSPTLMPAGSQPTAGLHPPVRVARTLDGRVGRGAGDAAPLAHALGTRDAHGLVVLVGRRRHRELLALLLGVLGLGSVERGVERGRDRVEALCCQLNPLLMLGSSFRRYGSFLATLYDRQSPAAATLGHI